MAVTTKELAEICNVSRRTVTRALSGTGRINAQTKQMILDKARELEYEPDLLARSLVKGRTMSIGVVLCDLKNMYFPQVIDAMDSVAREKDYVMNIMLHDNDKATEENIIRRLAGNKIDGLILDLASNDAAHYGYLKKYPFPIVVVGGKILEGYSYVGNNEYEAARDAAERILQRGYRSLYFVFPGMGRTGDSFGGHMERLHGCSGAAEEAGVKFDVLGSSGYVEEALRILRESDAPPAFLCSGDIYAGYIIMRLAENGYTAGTDYGIMGFDHLDIMKMFPKKLTTIENHIEALGRRTMEHLIGKIEEKEETKTIYIPYEFIEGETI